MADSEFAQAMASLADAMADAKDDWWIIGSGAVALHGADPGPMSDIDVLLSIRDLEALYEGLPLSDTRDSRKGQFLSQRFGVWSEPPMPVEFMAGFSQKIDGLWREVKLNTRERIRMGDRNLFVPEKSELISLLLQFGRPKDLMRAATLSE